MSRPSDFEELGAEVNCLSVVSFDVFELQLPSGAPYWKITLHASRRNGNGILARLCDVSRYGATLDECLDKLGVKFEPEQGGLWT